MKIVITSHGTRGDIQPYLALAVGLQSAGHQVTLATSYSYTEWIQGYGVQAHPTPFDIQEFTQRPETQVVIKSRNFIRLMRVMRDMTRENAEGQDAVWAAIQGADLVIQSPTSSGALEAVSLRGVPAVFAVPLPFAPTRAFPSFFSLSRFSLGGGYNAFTHWLMHGVLWSALGRPITNPLRKKLGLRAWRSFGEVLAQTRALGTPWVYGFSAHVIPKPADWDEYQHVTGYWFLDSPPDWQPAPELAQFLESGSPPIYIGFGSMGTDNPERQTQLALRALELSGQRGVLAAGWGGLTRQATPPNVLFVDNVPHNWLFPRVAAVVHHGGAGTTAAGFRAGVPNIVTPFAGDQIAWAERVEMLGVGPRAPEMKKLTAEKLAGAINVAVNDESLRARAAALGEKIRAENGVARAVEIIERHAAEYPNRSK